MRHRHSQHKEIYFALIKENVRKLQNMNPMSGCKVMDFNEGLNFLNGFKV